MARKPKWTVGMTAYVANVLLDRIFLHKARVCEVWPGGLGLEDYVGPEGRCAGWDGRDAIGQNEAYSSRQAALNAFAQAQDKLAREQDKEAKRCTALATRTRLLAKRARRAALAKETP